MTQAGQAGPSSSTRIPSAHSRPAGFGWADTSLTCPRILLPTGTGKLLPAQRRRGRGRSDERPQGTRPRDHPLARIVATGVSALSPEIMGLGPVEATRQATRRVGMTISDIDLVKINEAFAAQVIPSYRELGIGIDPLNVHGGAIPLGHPLGTTGARITATLLNGLVARDTTVGVKAVRVGGGQGMAIIVERLSGAPGPRKPGRPHTRQLRPRPAGSSAESSRSGAAGRPSRSARRRRSG